MDKEKLRKISGSLKFEANDKVVEQIAELYAELENKIVLMQKINTDNVEPMARVDSTPISFLREDTPGEALPKELILKNAPSTEGDFVVINKGGSND